MKRMNGTIAAVVCAAVLLTAGSALAWGGRGGKAMGGQQGMMNQQNAQTQFQPGQRMMNPGTNPRMSGPMANRQMMGRGGNFGGRCAAGNQQQMMGRRGSFGNNRGPAGNQQMMGRRGNFGNGGRMGMWASVEIPQEIKDKQTEMAKLSLEMRNEMGKKPIDRTRIEELYKKRVELRNELSGWRMQQRLDMIEKLQK